MFNFLSNLVKTTFITIVFLLGINLFSIIMLFLFAKIFNYLSSNYLEKVVAFSDIIQSWYLFIQGIEVSFYSGWFLMSNIIGILSLMFVYFMKVKFYKIDFFILN